MNIVTISGSAQSDSINEKLLKGLAHLFPKHQFNHCSELMDFPLFTPTRNEHPPVFILKFKEQIREADLVIIATPEYVYNIPAVLKNALEWVTSSGELNEKKVLIFTYTPSAPRGDKAMQSLKWSLQALNAKIIAELPLYQSNLKISNEGNLEGKESIEEIKMLFEFIG